MLSRPVVVAQLVERLLPTPEILRSNPVISKINLQSTILIDENKEKEAVNGPLKTILSLTSIPGQL